MSTRIATMFFAMIAVFSLSFTTRMDVEKMNLCKSINHIGNAFAEKKIASLLGESSEGDDGVVIYDSKVDVEGLDDEFIADSETETVFFATYVNASASKLKAKFAELKSQISKCLGKSFETSKLDALETATFMYNDKVKIEVTIYHEDDEIDLNIDISKEE
jgi:hypothetical protein